VFLLLFIQVVHRGHIQSTHSLQPLELHYCALTLLLLLPRALTHAVHQGDIQSNAQQGKALK
jgi:hypothetical protein